MQPFLIHDNRFKAILGPSPTLDLLHENPKYAFAHEAGVFIPSENTLFITSNHFIHTDDTRSVQISKVTLTRQPNGHVDATITELPSSAIPMGNGGVNTQNPDEAIIFCAQGSHDLPSGLYRMSSRSPHDVTPILTDFYGKSFNSVNDVVVARDGAIWFTDPVYGYEHNHRPVPSLPGQVYRFEPETGAVRTLADGFLKPNGLCFSPDERTMYVTDTAQLRSYGNVDGTLPSSIYAFDVTYYHDQPFLTNRRLFAMAPVGIPDGIKCDLEGNVYSGCGDGVTVWSPGGVLLGRILVDGGVANFCFGRDGEMFLLNEHRLWRAQLKARGALLGI